MTRHPAPAAARRGPVASEDALWRWVRRALWTLAVGTTLTLVLAQAAGSDTPAGSAAALSSVLAAACLYQGLLAWNRDSSAVADPGDHLNGLSGTLALAALVNLLLLHVDGRVVGPVEQLAVLQISALVIVLGSTLTVASLAALTRDPRPWVMSLGVAGAGVAAGWQLAGTGGGPSPTLGLVSTATFGLGLGAARLLPAARTTTQIVTPQSAVVGALVVLSAAMTALVVATRFPPDRTTTVVAFAVAAVAGVSTRAATTIRDLASLAQRRVEALTDDLTGLANRRALNQRLAEVTRTREPTALLLLDLDRFKKLNDRHGHEAGDRLLARVGRVLNDVVPGAALAARLGGDEFAVLVGDPDQAHAVDLAARVRTDVATELLRAAELLGPGSRVDVDLSVGVAWSGRHQHTDLLRRADVAMYAAKATGAGVAVFDPESDRSHQERLALTEDLRLAFETGALPFEVHYQPQVGLDDGSVRGLEALVRWRHPRRGPVPPVEFLTLVENLGRMPDLTVFVLATASRDLSRFPPTGPGGTGRRPRMSVNLSAGCLSDPGLPAALLAALAPGAVAGDIVLEVTETTLMADADLALAVCSSLVVAGFELSIDDYGTGYSSLSYLNDLPAHELKIDRSFCARVVEDPRVATIVAATVDLAHRLGLRVVAEGAEDTVVVEALRLLGCDLVQGFALTPALPVVELLDWVRARQPGPRELVGRAAADVVGPGRPDRPGGR
ncbi:putative bifunctional diguanylate cyclase/phosphodiesterase [Kineococcus gynurae]|uniref:Bifunctional diguanylate cyclase/phosphodiesterase n=1 Tax=Kineococcus gynurae TaxID=452979 RepID=A0ABV5LQ15_9ACTN